MKTRIALFALTVGVFAITGCAGTQVAVDRFGNMQPSIQDFELSANTGAVESETRPFFMPSQFGALSLFGFNDFQAGQTPFTFRLPYNFGGSLTLFNGIQLMQKPLQVVFPYNPDASLILFKFNGFQVKIMPMTDGGF